MNNAVTSRRGCVGFVLPLLVIGLLVAPAGAASYEELQARVARGEVVPVDDLRRAQQRELERIRADYDARARAQGGQTDALKAEYVEAVNGVQKKYNDIDTRNTRVKETLERAGAQDTGSDTKDVRADKDSGSPKAETNKKVVDDLKARGHDVDTSQPHKVVDRTDDHTHWLADTPEGAKAKAADTDAYRTTGGREAVGNKGEVRDALGEQLDHRGKFEHGRAAGDLKTQGKTLVKAADSAGGAKAFDPTQKTIVKSVGPDGKEGVLQKDGKFVKDPGKTLRDVPDLSEAQAKRVYEQGKALKDYGDTVQAGITELGDSSEVQRQKVAKWQEDAAKIMDTAEVRGQRQSALRDTVRENFGESYEKAQNTDSMRANPDPKVTDPAAAKREAAFDKYRTNDDPDFKNRAQGIEQDRARVRESQRVGEDYVAGEKVKPSAEDTYTGGWKDPQAADPHAAAAPDAGPAAKSKPAPDAVPAAKKLPAGAADVPGTTATVAKPGIGEQILGGVDTAGQIADAGARQMGKAVDENRDLGARDALDAATDASGVPAMYDAGKRSAEAELAKVHRGEQGRLEAAGRAAVNTAKQVVVDPINDTVDRAIKEEEARAARAGEEPDYLRSSGNAAAEIAGTFTGVKGVADAYAETQTWQERADAAAQQAAIKQKVDDEVRWREQRMRTLQGQLEQLGMTGDLNDPKTVAEIDAKLAALRAEEDRLQRTAAMAERTLGESDPERVARAKQIAASVPRSGDIEDYVNQMLTDRGVRRGAPALGAPAGDEAGQGDQRAGGADPLDEPADTAAMDDDIAQVLEEAQRDGRQAVDEATAATREQAERARMQVAAAGARARQAAESWDAGPAVGVEHFQEAVVQDRIRRGDPPPGQDIVEPYRGDYPDGGSEVAGIPSGGRQPGDDTAEQGGGGSQGGTALPGLPRTGPGMPGAGAGGGGGMDRATCMNACLSPLQRMPADVENPAEWRANLQRHCEFQCKAAEQASRDPSGFDPVRHCVDSYRNMNPGVGGEALAAVERACRESGAAPRPRSAPRSAAGGAPVGELPPGYSGGGLLGQGN